MFFVVGVGESGSVIEYGGVENVNLCGEGYVEGGLS